MPVYGLTEDGLVIKSLPVIRDELGSSVQNIFGNSIDVGDRSTFGQLLGILAEREALLWELLEVVNSSQDPDKATGAGLDALCILTGTTRPAASTSTVIMTLTGTPTTVVPSGTIAKTASTGAKFKTSSNATITALTAWAGSTAYVVGDRRTNSSKCYQCITAGTSASSGGPSTTAASIVDGTVTWTYLGDGTGAIDVNGESVEAGPIVAVARDLSVKDSAVGGWSSVINLTDANEGRDQAEDGELRELREAELAGPGTSTLDAIRAEITKLEDVESVTVFENNTDTTDANGLPPHSVEALVRGPDPNTAAFNQTIWDTLLDSVAAGIQTYGNTTGTATDDEGITHTIKFSLPTNINIYVVIGVLKNALTYPAAGDAEIKTAIVEWGDDQDTGKDVTPSGVAAQAFSVDGVLEVSYVGVSTTSISTPTTWTALTVYSIGNVVVNSGRVYKCTTGGTSAASGGPTSTASSITDGTVTWTCLSTTIAISLRELAVFDTSRITVASTSGTP